MCGNQTREPRQKRSIEKKRQIVDAGYALFCEKGYYHTHTAEIARRAGVSTGIVYRYFENKLEILLAAVELYTDAVLGQVRQAVSVPLAQGGLPELAEACIGAVIESHTMNRRAHDEFVALALLHDEVYRRFAALEDAIVDLLCGYLQQAGLPGGGLRARVLVSYGMAEQLSHAWLRAAQPQKELQSLRAATVRAIVSLLQTEA